VSAAPIPRRIIVADDDPAIRQVLVMMLTKAGFEVEATGSGVEALAAATRNPPHVFILDVKMPEMDGIETIKRLKADPRLETIPVIFLSGRSEIEHKVEGLDLGAADYVAKPFNATELLARVRSSLRAGRNTQSRKLRQLEEELDLAGTIQQSLLPKKPPPNRGLEVYGEMLPMRKVGGDYYDFVDGVDTQIICIGDVAGKGIPAALVMVMARTFLNNFDTNIVDTRMTLLGLNRLLFDNTDSGTFMSMVLFKWNVPEQKMYYTGAGHEHLMIYRARTREIQVLKTGGQVLGLRAQIIDQLRELELVLDVGDSLLLYTDGVTEATSPDDVEYGIDRLRASFATCAELPAEEIVETIFARLSEFTQGQRQNDDITLVALRRVEHTP